MPSSSSSQATHYTIAALAPHAHLFESTCTLPAPDPARPGVPPAHLGAGQLPDSRVRAQRRRDPGEDATVPVDVRKESKDTWRAAPCAGPLTVTMRVYAFDVSVRTAYLDERRAYFNGGSVFLCPVGREHAPCTARHPPARTVARSQRAASRPRCHATVRRPFGFGRYRADDYDEPDRPSGRDRRLRCTCVRGGRRAARRHDHRRARRRPRPAGRAISRASADGRSSCSTEPVRARRSIAICSR